MQKSDNLYKSLTDDLKYLCYLYQWIHNISLMMTFNLVISYFWDNQNQIHPLETMNVETFQVEPKKWSS